MPWRFDLHRRGRVLKQGPWRSAAPKRKHDIEDLDLTQNFYRRSYALLFEAK